MQVSILVDLVSALAHSGLQTFIHFPQAQHDPEDHKHHEPANWSAWRGRYQPCSRVCTLLVIQLIHKKTWFWAKKIFNISFQFIYYKVLQYLKTSTYTHFKNLLLQFIHLCLPRLCPPILVLSLCEIYPVSKLV